MRQMYFLDALINNNDIALNVCKLCKISALCRGITLAEKLSPVIINPYLENVDHELFLDLPYLDKEYYGRAEIFHG